MYFFKYLPESVADTVIFVLLLCRGKDHESEEDLALWEEVFLLELCSLTASQIFPAEK